MTEPSADNPLNVVDPGAHESCFLRSGEMKWHEVAGQKGATGVSALPTGLMRAEILGDPSKPGLSIFRMRYPPNYRVPPHRHWMAEHTTVIEGSVYVGIGESFDESSMEEYSADDFFTMPVGTPHYVLTRADQSPVFELHVIGPWAMSYCEPEDHPHK